jgi:hypothetical protein
LILQFDRLGMPYGSTTQPYSQHTLSCPRRI